MIYQKELLIYVLKFEFKLIYIYDIMRKNPKRKAKDREPRQKTRISSNKLSLNQQEKPQNSYKLDASNSEMKKITETGMFPQSNPDNFQSPIPIKKSNTTEFYSANLRQLSPLPFFQSKLNTISYQHKDLQLVQTPQIHNQKNELNVLSGQQSFDCILDFEKIYADKQPNNESPQNIISEDVFSQSELSQEQLTPIEQQKSKQHLQSKENIRQKAAKSQQQHIKITVQDQRNLNLTQQKKNVCNCKKSKCLKLYCDCFRMNKACDGCSCIGCHNTDAYEQQRNNAIFSMIDKNEQGFKPRIEGQKHSKGCNCKKSMCLKKYCQCFQAGLKCSDLCRCQLCKNTKNSE